MFWNRPIQRSADTDLVLKRTNLLTSDFTSHMISLKNEKFKKLGKILWIKLIVKIDNKILIIGLNMQFL